MVKLFG
jgi:hypothetical protein